MKLLLLILISFFTISVKAQIAPSLEGAVTYSNRKGDSTVSLLSMYSGAQRFFAHLGHTHLRGDYSLDKSGNAILKADSTGQLLLLIPIGKDSIRYANSILRKYIQN